MKDFAMNHPRRVASARHLERQPFVAPATKGCHTVFSPAGGLALLLLAATVPGAVAASPHRLIAWTNFSGFVAMTNADAQVEWVSPKMPCTPANELIASWNAELPADGWLRPEVRAFHGDQPTKFFQLGQWSRNAARHPQASVKGQADAEGDVDTDTLQLKQPADAFQLRLNLGPATNQARLKFLSVVLTDTRVISVPRSPLRAAWGKELPVKPISQMAYADGRAWCSPTTVTMLLQFWAKQLDRADLALDVPEVAHGIYDETWQGTGNWSFNMAFAGSYPGLRAYVTRFNDVRELETWIAHGQPVGISVCYDKLRGTGPGPNGHLMVCVGFTKRGEVILNDPGTRFQMRKTFTREQLIAGWAHSRNAVYLIHPEGAALPEDVEHHWTPTP